MTEDAASSPDAADRPSTDVGSSATGAPSDRNPAQTPRAVTTQDDDEEDEWRHPPIAPVDETNPLKSLGKAVADTITGPGQDTPATPEASKTPKR